MKTCNKTVVKVGATFYLYVTSGVIGKAYCGKAGAFDVSDVTISFFISF
jgi:hypothetical protein